MRFLLFRTDTIAIDPREGGNSFEVNEESYEIFDAPNSAAAEQIALETIKSLSPWDAEVTKRGMEMALSVTFHVYQLEQTAHKVVARKEISIETIGGTTVTEAFKISDIPW